MRTWFVRRPDLLDEVRDTVRDRYPGLTLVEDGDVVLVKGYFPVRGAAGEYLDQFLVEVHFRPTYPDSMPIVFEVGGRIPRIMDRHIVPGDGSACLMVPEEWDQNWPDHSFAAFLEGPVHNFFLGQLFQEEGLPWPFGERLHKVDGLFQSYADMVGFAEKDAIERALDFARRGPAKGHWPCPCGSGVRIRNCHQDAIRKINRIKRTVADSALARLAFYRNDSEQEIASRKLP